MGAKSKPGRPRKPAVKRSVKAADRRARTAAVPSATFDQQILDAIEDELDCQRVVSGDDSRTARLYYDDYN